MTEQMWQEVMQRLAHEPVISLSMHCVSCWYEVHMTLFPAQDSSSLCARHTASTRKRRPVPIITRTIAEEVGAP